MTTKLYLHIIEETLSCIKSHIHFQVSPASTSEIFNKNFKIGHFYPQFTLSLGRDAICSYLTGFGELQSKLVQGGTSYTLRRSSRIVFRFGDFPSREFARNTYCFGSLNS